MPNTIQTRGLSMQGEGNLLRKYIQITIVKKRGAMHE